MKTISLLTLLLFSTMPLLAQPSKSKAKEKPKVEWLSYETEDFAIQYPSNWRLMEENSLGALFFLFSPADSVGDPFSENVNLIQQDLSGMNLDLDAYTDLSVRQIESLLPESEILENARLEKNGQPYQKLIYAGMQGENLLQFEQYYWVMEETAYVLTLTCYQSSFAAFQPVGERILDSFVLKL
jgi:hypothetical protein